MLLERTKLPTTTTSNNNKNFMSQQFLCFRVLFLVLGLVVPSSWSFAWYGPTICGPYPGSDNDESVVLCADFFATWFQRLPQGTLAPTPIPSAAPPSSVSSQVPSPSPTYGIIGRNSWVRQSVTYEYGVLLPADADGCTKVEPITTVSVELFRNDKCAVKIDDELCASCDLCSENVFAMYSADCTNIPFGRNVTCEPTQRQVDSEVNLFFPLTVDAPAVQRPVPTLQPTTTPPTRSPTHSPIQQPLIPAKKCAKLSGCFLENLSTTRGKPVKLNPKTSAVNGYTLQNGNRYSIRCNIKGGSGGGGIKKIEFQFAGQTRPDYFAPFYMGGNRGKKNIAPVEYLSNGCGKKEVVVTGTNWRGGTCFHETFTLEAQC